MDNKKRIIPRKQGFYEKYLKRILDITCALVLGALLSPLLLAVALLVRGKLGSPVIFKQKRPGLDEKIFTLYKFRTMTDKKDGYGNLLPDGVRLTSFGKRLRATSLDELPELWNILTGKLSFVGPRPQLVRDMIFMSEEQRRRYTVKPGLTGLAQVNGRNAISWDKKLDYDLKYIEKITFRGDVKILLRTVWTAFMKQEGITDENMATAEDYGDYLLRTKKVGREKYDDLQKQAIELLKADHD